MLCFLVQLRWNPGRNSARTAIWPNNISAKKKAGAARLRLSRNEMRGLEFHLAAEGADGTQYAGSEQQ